jgi:hypothetical protein
MAIGVAAPVKGSTAFDDDGALGATSIPSNQRDKLLKRGTKLTSGHSIWCPTSHQKLSFESIALSMQDGEVSPIVRNSSVIAFLLVLLTQGALVNRFLVRDIREDISQFLLNVLERSGRLLHYKGSRMVDKIHVRR